MGAQKAGTLKPGDRVRIKSAAAVVGRVTELRGPLGPNGSQVYRVRVRRKPKPAYVEVVEDQLEAIPTP